ncbi:MAG: FliI/YscN family ATPase [Pseudomonadota bacterium]
MLAEAIRDMKRLDTRRYSGRVAGLEGLRIEAVGPAEALRLGAYARFGGPDGPRGELVGFNDGKAVFIACDPVEGLRPGDEMLFSYDDAFARPCEDWLGRVLDAFGEPVDGGGAIAEGAAPRLLRGRPPSAQARARVNAPLSLGVRALDLFAPCADGQRMGLFAGSGVGKSTLMSMLARDADADVVVIGLIGERGREVREFVEDTLGAEGLARAVIVSATSDEPAPKRRRAAWLTLTIAEHFRDKGKRVLCLLDSVTRFALAQREIGLAAGEPPTTRGYTPSVFAELPKLLERAGPGVAVPAGAPQGYITGLFTVLVDGDDHNEPVADAVRGILDGHVVLSRQIAERGRYPAIDVLKSLSRLAAALQGPEQTEIIRDARRVMSLYADMEELLRIGAYTRGSDPDVDRAVQLAPHLDAFLAQGMDEATPPDAALQTLAQILNPNALEERAVQAPG